MNIMKIIIGVCSILFIMIGIDKFYPFMEPPCSLMDDISPVLWKGLGILDIAAGILIWHPKFRKPIAALFIILMLVFSAMHLFHNTRDVGGAVFMAVLLTVVLWNPRFLQGKK